MSSGSEARPVIVALAGSLLTRPHGPPSVRQKVLARLAAELHHPEVPLVVVHGSGSFGAEAPIDVAGGSVPLPHSPNSRRIRQSAIAAASSLRLHNAVLDALLAGGSRPWSVAPSAICSLDRGRISELQAAPLMAAVARGLVPVTFADVVPDASWGFSSVSADSLSFELARQGVADRCLFVTDYPGLVEWGRPGRPQAVPSVAGPIADGELRTGSRTGASRGAVGKAALLASLGELGANAGVISGLSDGRLSRAIRGDPVYGSWSTGRSR